MITGFIDPKETMPIRSCLYTKTVQMLSCELYEEGDIRGGMLLSRCAPRPGRIRTQLSAGHDRHHLEKALESFKRIGEKYDILGKPKDLIS